MKYLVLGSSGQIGKPLCEFLKESGNFVSTFDLVENELEDLRIYNNELLKQKVKENDFIFFLAFDVGGSRYLSKYQNSYDFLQNNIKLMSNTFEIIKEYKKPFIFASSQMSNMDYSSYGLSKSIGELYTKFLNGITVKFWNVYGPERDLEKSHVITDFILKAKRTGIIDMLTDGNEERQFLHALDCCAALKELSVRYSELDKTKNYHITSFKWNTVADVAEIVQSYVPNSIIQKSDKKDTVQLNKKNEPDDYILKYWQPKISLKEGIKLVIQEMDL